MRRTLPAVPVVALFVLLLLTPPGVARGDLSADGPRLVAGPALLGAPLGVELEGGTPGAALLLLLSAADGGVPTVLARDVLGADGRWRGVLPLPDDEALAHQPFQLQALVGGGATGRPVLTDPLVRWPFALDLDVDVDRDGLVEAVADDLDEHLWSSTRGAVFLHNADDDDDNGVVDALDNRVNAGGDELDLAPVVLQPMTAVPGAWSGELLVDEAAAPWVRLFRNQGGIWSRFDPALHNPLDAATLVAGLTLGLEALDYAQVPVGGTGGWDGEVLLSVSLRDGSGQLRALDEVRLRVAPFVLHSNLDAVHKVLVTRKNNTGLFCSELGPPVQAAGSVLEEIDGIVMGPAYDVWVQDAMEFGTSTLPAPGGPRSLPVVLRSPRDWPLDPWTEDHCLGPDFGYAFKGDYRPGVDWIDWFGNLDCTPPLPGWPLGRLYTGYQGPVAMHPDVLAFLEAQGVQAPVLQIDTGWLLIGHVDEEVCFVPSHVGKPYRVLMPGTTMALDILADLSAEGKGGLAVFAGTGDETTVDGLLNAPAFVTYNVGLQDAIDAVRQQLLDGLPLDPADIIEVPSLFWKGGGTERAIAHMPNMVNALVVGDHVITSDPFGPMDGGVDRFGQPLVEAMEAIGLTVDFVDDWYPYHEWWGEVHCGTNAVRAPPAVPWWELP